MATNTIYADAKSGTLYDYNIWPGDNPTCAETSKDVYANDETAQIGSSGGHSFPDRVVLLTNEASAAQRWYCENTYGSYFECHTTRGYLYFDTSGLSGKTVASVKIKLYFTSCYYSDIYGASVAGWAVHQDSEGTYPHDTLAVGDYDKDHYSSIATMSKSAMSTATGADTSPNEYIELSIPASAINTEGMTKLVIVQYDPAEWAAGVYNGRLTFQGADGANVPTLEIITAAPTVTTQAATVPVIGGATLNGNITDNEGASITQHGFIWKAGSDPVDIAGADGYSELGAGSEGSFDQAKTGLAEGTLFYVRAYATSSEGTGYGAAVSFTTGQIHSGAVSLSPGVSVESVATRVKDAIAAIGLSSSLSVAGNRIAGGSVAVIPALSVEAISGVIRPAVASMSPGVNLSIDPLVYTFASAAIVADVSIEADANAIKSAVATIAPVIGVLAAANYITTGSVVGITPNLDVEPRANYITCAVATIALAISQSALATRVIDGGTVAVEITATVSAAAIRYLFTSIGLSGEFAPGSDIEIDSDNMTFKVDGVNAIEDMVGGFSHVAPGDSTITYEDDEGTRDVTLELDYTPRDA